MLQIRNDRLDTGEWGAVDKSAQWQVLKTAVADKTDGAAEAVREMYAVVKADVTEYLTQADVFGPHHTLRRDGTLVLSRGGMMAATAALAGARAEPNLTREQTATAAKHLLGHYRQENVNLQPPQSLLDFSGVGEMAHLEARITSEMKPQDIAIAPGVSIFALKEHDPDPMEVVVEIPSGVSARGWVYGKVVIRHLAEQIAAKMHAGYLGHQRVENLETEFPPPVTHWVGALYRDGSAYVRGVVDKAAPDLKRWIRAGAITQVSIYGQMDNEQREGKTHVTRIGLMSIDWVPLDRAGMKTRVVAVGEQTERKVEMVGDQTMTVAELLGELRRQGAKPDVVIAGMGWDVKILAKELGWELGKVAGEIDAKEWEKLLERGKMAGEIAEVFGLGEDADLREAVKAAHEAQQAGEVAAHDKLIDKVLGEMVQTEAVRVLVKRMLHLEPTSDEAAIKQAVGEMLEDDGVKKALADVFKEDPIAPKTDTRSSGSSNTIKWASI